MRCPKCPAAPLQPVSVRPGLETDSCPGCGGIWLDKAELYQFVSDPKKLHAQFVEAYKLVSQTKHSCPRCSRPMKSAVFPAAGLEFEVCAQCGGNWFDAGEVGRLKIALSAAVEAAGERSPEKPPEKRPLPRYPATAEGGPQRVPAPEWKPLESRSGSQTFFLFSLVLGGAAVLALALGAALKRAFPDLF